MAIGAFDFLDQLLVQKYAEMQVENHEDKVSAVSPKEMFESMNSFSSVNRNMLALNQQLSSACQALNAVNVQYRQAMTVEELYDLEPGSINA